jgi:hypothetical protein
MTNVLVLGNSRTPEMRPILCCLEQHAPGSAIEHAETIEHALGLTIDRHWFPDLGVVCQHWPDEFARSGVERLLSLLPVTRWVCCFGAWCESDGRNRDIWPLSVRVAARCAGDRIRRELAVLAGEQSALPLTAARDEIFEFDCPLPYEPFLEGPVLVKSPDGALRRSISSLLTTIRNPKSKIQNPIAVVWDVDPCSEAVLSQLRNFSSQNRDVAVVALSGFAHPEDVQALRCCGADAVLTKLTAPAELPRALASAISLKRTAVA